MHIISCSDYVCSSAWLSFTCSCTSHYNEVNDKECKITRVSETNRKGIASLHTRLSMLEDVARIIIQFWVEVKKWILTKSADVTDIDAKILSIHAIVVRANPSDSSTYT